MRAFVTGASGFLGSHLVEALVAKGHEVVALVRGKEATGGDGVTVRRGDVLDAASIEDAAAGCDVVFHCAGKVSRKREDAELLHKLHVTGTKTVLDACRKAGVGRAVVASTSGTVAVSDDPEHIANENDETPIGIISKWPYYRTKLYAEQAALDRNDDAFTVVCVNPTLLLGPGDLRGSSTEDVRLFLERKIPAIPDGGLSFVDARDAAEGMCLAAERGVPGERYLLGACNLTLREFFARLERVSGVRAPWLPLPRALTKLGLPFDKLGVDSVSLEMSQYYWYLDATKAEEELGWSSRDPNETLNDTVDDLRARGVVWPEGAPAAEPWRHPHHTEKKHDA
jgi:dihydroflavonol-4-reductase